MLPYPAFARRTFVLIASFLLVLTASGRSDAGEALVVFAASSLTDVVSELGLAFEEKYDKNVLFSFAATSVLARQIKDGAPAHIFISASEAWMEDVFMAGGTASDSALTIAENRLALVTSLDTTTSVEGSDGILAVGFEIINHDPNLPIAIGNPDHVPAGIYARQALQHLGVWETLENRLAPMPNALSVLTSVLRGEVAAGIVYGSDVFVSGNIRSLGTFPLASHDPIRYQAALVRGRSHPSANAFLSFLVSSEAKSVFRDFNFLSPRP